MYRIARMKTAALALAALLAGGCAAAPEPRRSEAHDLCAAQGRQFVKEAYGVGGLGIVKPPPAPDGPGDGGAASGGPRPLEILTGLVGVRVGTIGMGNLETSRAPVPPPAPPPERKLALKDVGITHASLGRGGKANGIATFTNPKGARLVLEATTTVPGYGFKVNVPVHHQGRVGFWVACLGERPAQVDWTFTLQDAEGHRSNAVTRPVACSGEPLPGSAPHLDSVELEAEDVVAGWKTSGLARYTASSDPVTLLARADTSGAQWGAAPPAKDRGRQRRFWVACPVDRIHTVTWRFSLQDTFGRVSNVVEKLVACGMCWEPRDDRAR
jgi:hypothetical protein